MSQQELDQAESWMSREASKFWSFCLSTPLNQIKVGHWGLHSVTHGYDILYDGRTEMMMMVVGQELKRDKPDDTFSGSRYRIEK